MPAVSPRLLLLLLLLPATGCGVKDALVSLGAGDGPEYDATAVPQPLPPEVAKAWTDTGATLGWMRPDEHGYFRFRKGGGAGPGDVPALEWIGWSAGLVPKLPAPGVPFGLQLYGKNLADASLKELDGLAHLKVLGLGSTSVTDAGLKELAGLRLWELDLNGTKVGDAGLKDLAGQRRLISLNLYATKVTDAGLPHLARLKSLRLLDLGYTAVTVEGLDELNSQLPQRAASSRFAERRGE